MDPYAIFKQLIWDQLIAALIKRLFAEIPFLAWGPVGIIVKWLIMTLGDKIFEAVKLQIQLEAIVLRNAAHQKAFEQAATNLRIIAVDRGVDSEEFKNAREAHKKALAAFIRFDQ